MRSGIAATIFMVFFIISSGCTRESNVDKKPSGQKSEVHQNSVKVKIPQEFFNYIGCVGEKFPKNKDLQESCSPDYFSLRAIDLNGDGEDELLIDSSGNIHWSGSGGYYTWIFQKKGNRYQIIGEFLGGEVSPLSTETRGYFDLKQNYKHYGTAEPWEDRTSKYIWNGKEYTKKI
jgi:hypothetical protein